jgi:peroxiredoxin
MLAALLVCSALADQPYEPGSVATYRGSFQSVKEQRNPGLEFQLTVVVGDDEEGATEVLWLLSDSSTRPIPWQNRWGDAKWLREKRSLDGPLPSFDYEHSTGRSLALVGIPLPVPLFGELSEGTTWSEGKLQYEVHAGGSVDDRATWDVTARTMVGRRRTITIDRETRQVYALREQVFVGQGEEHVLRYKLASREVLDRERLDRTRSALSAWTDARDAWQKTAEPRTPESIAAADKSLVAGLEELKQISANTPVAALVTATATQVKSDGEKRGALSALRTRMMGKPLPKFETRDVTGKAWSNADLKGKTTVIQFWGYRDDDLREPYGQVGYLDFLARQQGDKVQVLGVAVPKEGETAAPRAAVRKFRDFMNLSYPLLLEEGKLLQAIGDPRKAGGELPLFIVVDSAGKVVEYKAGLYEVKRDEGLAELAAVIKQAAAQRE